MYFRGKCLRHKSLTVSFVAPATWQPWRVKTRSELATLAPKKTANPILGFNLSYDEGGHIVPPQSVFIFLPKISPPDQTLRPTCKFLILGLLYHDFFFLLKI